MNEMPATTKRAPPAPLWEAQFLAQAERSAREDQEFYEADLPTPIDRLRLFIRYDVRIGDGPVIGFKTQEDAACHMVDQLGKAPAGTTATVQEVFIEEKDPVKQKEYSHIPSAHK